MNGQEIQLTPTEYDILRTLVISAGKVITNRQFFTRYGGRVMMICTFCG